MKRIFITAIVLLHLGAGFAIAGQFGPAEPQTKPGQFSLGIGVHYHADKWEFENVTTDISQIQSFLQIHWGIFPRWELYLKGGMANLDIDDVLINAGLSDFEGKYKPFGTAGVKALIYRGKYLDMGGFAEGSVFANYDDSTAAGVGLNVRSYVSTNAGLVFQKELEGALLYAGPFAYYHKADYTSTGGNILPSGTVKPDSFIGGFVGIRWIALDDIIVTTEIQMRDEISGSAAISFLF